jgi:hypothetical protein
MLATRFALMNLCADSRMPFFLLTAISCLVSMAGSAILAEPPQATFSGTTIRLEPSGATFDLPDDWIEWYRDRHDNLHLNRAELQKVKDAIAYFDADYARVVNAVLPFESCAIHAGGEGWGSESRSVADLQMRAYLGDWSLKTLQRLIAEKGLSTARNISHRETGMSTSKDILFRKDVVSEWHRSAIRFPVKYRDNVDEVYGGANVEFYVRSFGADTVVLVFMYSDPCTQKKYMQTIFSSFKHPKNGKN